MRAGMDEATGRLLEGWDHCVQSIRIILTTRVGTRVMRRAFGSAALDLQDRTATPRRIMQIYATIAAALRRHEPGFRLRAIRLVSGGADGQFVFELSGIFYPRGHLGDYETTEERSAQIGLVQGSLAA